MFGGKSHSIEMSDTFFKCRDAQTACLICLRQLLNLSRFPCSFLLEHFSCHFFMLFVSNRKGIDHPKIKVTVIFLLPTVLFIHPDCFEWNGCRDI